MTFAQLLSEVKQLPSTPGIYRYYDQSGRLLYIGKAANLRRRVSSYFLRQQDARLSKLVTAITRIEIVSTDSIVEALFKEAYEINTKRPPFNIRSKDDKTFIVIGITHEPYPRVILTRPTRAAAQQLKYRFGPYTSAEAARRAVDIIRRIIPFRTRCRPESGRACLDSQIGLCPGICYGQITQKEYAKNISQLRLIFEGKRGELVTRLEKAMRAAARADRFEEAAVLRNRLSALRHIRDVALLQRDNLAEPDYRTIPARIEAYDISNISGDYAVGSMVVINQGKSDPSQYRKFRIKTVTGQNDLLMMEEILRRRLNHVDWPRPDLLVLDGGQQHLRVGQRVLHDLKLSIALIAVAKGPKRKGLDIYTDNPAYRLPDPALRTILFRAREEAHRFAISYHRVRRAKGFLVD